jgi:hypothetical protein
VRAICGWGGFILAVIRSPLKPDKLNSAQGAAQTQAPTRQIGPRSESLLCATLLRANLQ